MPGRNRYQAYTLANFRAIPQMERLSEEMKFDIEVVGRVLPFKTNNFVVEQLIDWERVPDDPMFILTFPQRDMLMPQHYEEVARLLRAGADAGCSSIRIRPGNPATTYPRWRERVSMACSTSIAKRCCFSPARGRPAMPIAASASDGRSSWACPISSSPVARWIA